MANQLYKSDITASSEYEGFKDYVLTLMGEYLVSVEVGDEHIEAAFYKAKKFYQKRGNDNLKHRFISFPVEKGKLEYDLNDEEGRVETILKVIQTRGGFLGGTEDPFEISYLNRTLFNYSSGGSPDILVYELNQMQFDNLRRISAYEPQFFHDKLNNKIKLLKQPRANEDWFLEVHLHLSDDEYMNMDWIQRYTTAELKMILGSAYRKFGSIDTPAGQTNLSGDQMIQEGQEEKRDLIEEIKNFVDSGYPMGMPITIG